MYCLETIHDLEAKARKREENEAREDKREEAFCSGRKIA